MTTTTTKYTLGPWIDDGDGVVSALVDPENSKTYIAPICVIDDEWTEEIIKANAHLIAAAPDMYEALKRITTELQYVHEVAADDRAFKVERKNLFASPEGVEAIKQAMAAIAKAEGRQ